MTRISDTYANMTLKLEPGDRLHRLVAILFDTYYDDLTPDRISELEQLAESWRWMNAEGQRLDRPS